MRVPFGQLLVRSDSYPDGGRGDALRRSSGDNGLPWADPANLRAATRSESRAGSESTVVTPTRLLRGEGRRIARKQPTCALAVVTGVVGSGTQGRFFDATWEARHGRGVAPRNATIGWRSDRESERPIVPRRPGNAGGGKGPHFRVLSEEDKGEEIGASLGTPTAARRLRKELCDGAKDPTQAVAAGPRGARRVRGPRGESCRRAGCVRCARPVR